MLDDSRDWIHRHTNAIMSFILGLTFGISVLALAFFESRSEVAAQVYQYGVQATGHADIGEDLIWLFCGIVVGASVTCLAWWRDHKARTVGLEKEHVLSRLLEDPGNQGSRARGTVGKDSER